MFLPTPGMLDAWRAAGKPPATPADVQTLERGLGIVLPPAYVDFIRQFGFVSFGDDAERRWRFDCRYPQGGQVVVRPGHIAFLPRADQVVKAHRILTSTLDPDDRSLPAFPAHFLPVGNDLGQGAVLLELGGAAGQVAGRVWYWAEREWRWGTEDNTELGFVAEDFYAFINGLLPDPA